MSGRSINSVLVWVSKETLMAGAAPHADPPFRVGGAPRLAIGVTC